jgi:hypothetical protein
MRVPVVAGVGGGVGTTTVAAALRAHDAGRIAGRIAGRLPDILVCRGTFDSLRRATAVLDNAGPEPVPVVAVTLDGARMLRGPLRARLDLLEADADALVLLPHVRRWGTLADPLAETTRLLADPAERLPRPLRAYTAALRELVEAVASSGRLDARPHERPARRTGSDERAVRRDGVGPARSARFPLTTRPAPPPPAQRVPDPTALERAPRSRGIRIVPPDGPRATAASPAHARITAERVG